MSACLLAYLPELGTLTHRQISTLVGVAPLPDDSGSRSGYRRIQGGRGEVRGALYMSTVTAITHNPTIRTAYLSARFLAFTVAPPSGTCAAAITHLLAVEPATAAYAPRVRFQPGRILHEQQEEAGVEVDTPGVLEGFSIGRKS